MLLHKLIPCKRKNKRQSKNQWNCRFNWEIKRRTSKCSIWINKINNYSTNWVDSKRN